ncbi:TPR [Pyrrhoderma noxium]|uniref:TPR n=1 Tax=Pyrrhoderma noxium TaxID=2282107 RepID=A0A286UFV8_9AGAM|nr:TPR [Pyrrhoderma noxium]
MEGNYVVHLRKAVKDCTDRGLYHASKWASELLLAIPPERRRRTKREDQTVNNNVTIQENVNVNGVESPEVLEAVWEEDEQDLLAASRALAEAKEYMRASKLLLDCKSARGRFMRWYFDFLAEEKRALRDWHNLDYTLQHNSKSTGPSHAPSNPRPG